MIRSTRTRFESRAVLGALGAPELAHLLRSQLHGVEPADSTTLLAAGIALAAAALVACLAPRAQALRVNPAEALSCRVT